ncbi:MAG: YciI family protein [Phycisphaerales bacterium]|nr:YciI family protein [Phycisphaerales bacterium]
MPSFLLILRATRLEMLTQGPTDAERETIAAHFAYLTKLQADGTLSLAGRTTNSDERTLGIAIFQAADEAAARALVAADPCVTRGVMSAELLPFRVAIPDILV